MMANCRSYGISKWPWSNKTYIGSVAFVIAGFISSAVITALLRLTGN